MRPQSPFSRIRAFFRNPPVEAIRPILRIRPVQAVREVSRFPRAGSAPGLALLAVLSALAASNTGCANRSLLEKPDQGLTGAFITYGHPDVATNCDSLKTWARQDACRRESERVIEEPYRGSITIRNLATRRDTTSILDAQGRYHVALEPGFYAVCLKEECSDPIEVRLGDYASYGWRLPRVESESGTTPEAAGGNAPLPGNAVPTAGADGTPGIAEAGEGAE